MFTELDASESHQAVGISPSVDAVHFMVGDEPVVRLVAGFDTAGHTVSSFLSSGGAPLLQFRSAHPDREEPAMQSLVVGKAIEHSDTGGWLWNDRNAQRVMVAGDAQERVVTGMRYDTESGTLEIECGNQPTVSLVAAGDEIDPMLFKARMNALTTTWTNLLVNVGRQRQRSPDREVGPTRDDLVR